MSNSKAISDIQYKLSLLSSLHKGGKVTSLICILPQMFYAFADMYIFIYVQMYSVCVCAYK